MVSAVSTPNIAFVKYWGNRNDALRLPAADSLSMTLDSPTVEVTLEPAETLSIRSYNADRSPHILTPKEHARFQQYFSLAYRYIQSSTPYSLLPTPYALTLHSRIPSGIGLASSAAIFSALARAYVELLRAEHGITLSDQQISSLARLGSGSAARSIMGGFVAMITGRGEDIDSTHAIQIADENHWILHDIIIAPSLTEKKTGSTEGHMFAHTSPLFENRLRTVPRRMAECTDAILSKDFEKLQHVAEEDAWDLHKIAETSLPPLKYLTEDTYRITREITDLRKREHLAVLYTMDAGPTVHLICTEDAAKVVKDFAHTQKGCAVFETKVGNGAKCREMMLC